VLLITILITITRLSRCLSQHADSAIGLLGFLSVCLSIRPSVQSCYRLEMIIYIVKRFLDYLIWDH